MGDDRYRKLFDKIEPDPSARERIWDTTFTLRFDFEVGDEEKRKVEFSFDRFLGHITIRVDGQRIIKKIINNLRKSLSYEFTVGEKEKHHVRIALVRSYLPVGYRECTAWAYADDKLMGQYEGELYLKPKRYRDMTRKGRIAFISAVLVLFALITFLVIYHLPIDVDEEVYGVVFRAGTTEPDYLQPVRITVEGKYYRNIRIRQRYRFEGSVRVYARDEGPIPNTETGETVKRINIGVPLVEDMLDMVRSFTYSTDGGVFFMKPDSSAFMIIVFERDINGEPGHAGGSDGIYYAAPCNSREEAVDIVNEMRPLVWGKKAPLVE